MGRHVGRVTRKSDEDPSSKENDVAIIVDKPHTYKDALIGKKWDDQKYHDLTLFVLLQFVILQLSVLVRNQSKPRRNDTIDLLTLGHFCVPKMYPNVDFEGCLK